MPVINTILLIKSKLLGSKSHYGGKGNILAFTLNILSLFVIKISYVFLTLCHSFILNFHIFSL